MSNIKKIKNLRVKNLKVCDETVKNLNVLNSVTATNLIVTTNTTLNNVTADNAVINNLQVTNINGQDVTCDKNFTNSNYSLVTTNPLVNPGDFNQEVWDKLAAITLMQQADLAERLQCGRLQEKAIQTQYGCVVCPPNELVDCIVECGHIGICDCIGVSGPCPSVPLNIFGIKTVPPLTIINCDSPTSNPITQLLSTISYNLDVSNITGKLDTRVVTILVQLGYLDPSVPGTDKFVYQEVDFGNRQFGATLDTAYGEKYTGVIILPTDTIAYISNLPDSTSFAVQLVVFAEDGIKIDLPSTTNYRSRYSSRFNVRQNTATNGPVDTQSVTQTVGGQVQWANIYTNYSFIQTNVVSLQSNFNLAQLSPSTQWVMGWSFDGPNLPSGAPGGYFGINADGNGNFQVLASIFNAAIAATAAQSYVTVVAFGGEGTGFSLRITTDNISNFPITLNTNYTIRVNRQNLIPGTATWEFIITNVDNSTIVNLGTITTSDAYSFIVPNSPYQFSEYFGNSNSGPTGAIPPIPQSIITWSFPIENDVANSATWVPWTPPPQHCGACSIDPTLPNGPVTLSFGGCGTCLGVNACNTGC